MKEFREIVPANRGSHPRSEDLRYEVELNELAAQGWEYLCVVPPSAEYARGGHGSPRIIMVREFRPPGYTEAERGDSNGDGPAYR